MRKDYIAQWYEVREEQGISDRIHCFIHNSQEQQTQWHHFRHRDTDGIGMLANVREQLGYPASSLPRCRDLTEPGFWQTLNKVRRQRKDRTPKTVHWKKPVQQKPAKQPRLLQNLNLPCLTQPPSAA
ncbi:hypothetical protein HUF18_03505 [Thalassolituus sp. ST750PaO-4]|uniref:hypothetical protein n=1 Tax=Thalassolituus sp. ST750PaO-4 TaxID=2742965 RepID=UPI001CE24342|nr:hypothetical protein [Thalassolituus sp. ST750PaO-4]MCA6058828.1 hypothetical protein [Thalassolituus sp. ST750PaO-4]